MTKLVNLSRVRDCAVTERVCDALTEVLTHGARRLLKQAVEAEADAFIDERRGLKDERGDGGLCATATWPQERFIHAWVNMR